MSEKFKIQQCSCGNDHIDGRFWADEAGDNWAYVECDNCSKCTRRYRAENIIDAIKVAIDAWNDFNV